MKKLLSIVMCLCLIMSTLTFVNTTASAEGTDGYYTYSVSNGEATITDCDISISGDITIPSTLGGYPVTSIRISAFYGCSSLTSVVIPSGVTDIDWHAFSNCSSLTSITVENENQNYSSVDGVLFNKNKTSLIQYPMGNTRTSYTIPDSVTSIRLSAFEDCSSLTSVTIPESVTSIGNRAFQNCSKLTSITIPDSVTKIDFFTFADCTSLTSVTIGNGVTSIGYDAFYRCTSLTSITIPNSVRSIGVYAFAGCTSLINVNIGNGVTSIGDIFSGCTSLTSVTIGNSVTKISSDAFEDCSSLTSITVENENQNYSSSDGVLFNKNKTTLIQYPIGNTRTSYTIPSTVTSISNYAFYSCDSLESVTIPNSVTTIGSYAFAYCYSLKSVTIANSVTTIGSYAFYSSDSLESVTIPNSVTSIGGCAFEYCDSLTSVTIGNGVTSIGSSAFYDTAYYNNESNWENDVLYIGKYLIKTKRTISGSYSIKEDTKLIANYAFDYCSSLTSVTIPESVTSIGSSAFSSCDSLTDVYYSGSKKQWNKIVIGDYNYYLLNANIHFDSTYQDEAVNNGICTSTGSVYSNEYWNMIDNNIFPDFNASVKGNYYIIPGIKQTNINGEKVCKKMVAQGVCVAGNYMLITAYDSSEKNNSVVYVIDYNTKRYITTLVLYSKCHVGGIAYNSSNGEIYIADSDENKIRILYYSQIVEKANAHVDSSYVDFQDSFSVDITPSFVSFYADRIYLGTHITDTSDEFKSKMIAYSGSNHKLISGSNNFIPLKTQGAQFVSYCGKTYLICSCSYGRDYASSIKVYTAYKNSSGNFVKGDLFKTLTFPNMSEDICVYGDNLFTCFESAAKKYQPLLFNKCPYPVDRVTSNSLGEILKPNSRTFSLRSTQEEGEHSCIIEGKCGDDVTYALYNDGSLNITGQGEMYNYSTETAPWAEYVDTITAVYIDEGITNISENAFGGCSSLQEIYLPDSEISIGENAFADCDSELIVRSNSKSVNEFAQTQGFSVHKHEFVYDTTVEPTCCNDGYDVYVCSDSNCKSSECRNVIESTEQHEFELVESVESTCFAEGYDMYVCSNCGDCYNEELELLEHTISDEWVVETEATETQTGLKVKKCTVCEEVLETDEIRYGDCNIDEKVDVKDLLLMRKHIAKLNVDIDNINSDCNADSVVNINDILFLRKYLVKDIVDLGKF